MNREKLTMWAAIGALVVGLLSMLLRRRSVIHQTGDGSPLTMGDTNSPLSLSFGGRNINLGGGGNDYGMSSCGCGGSYGNNAVPKLAPIFGQTIRQLPYTKTPQPEPGLPVALIGNGAAI